MQKKIIEYCKLAKSKKQIAEYLGYKTVKTLRPHMQPLLDAGLLRMTIQDNPNDKRQRYVAVMK